MSGDMLGRVIKGRYKLIDEIGRGSFATVYIVRDTKTNRIFAMKAMLYEPADDGELLARFQREAHILLTLQDPHIVRIFEYGDESDLHYILMDYIDGQNLKYHTLTSGPMEPALALDYARQIAEGLDTAYKNGVVHRDIKPQNIVINSQGMAKITDFGLARSRETVTLTQSNVFMGTAYYIPPEQAESGRSADIRSDLYSVATVLFEMLSGHPPYEGDSAVDIVIKHMNDKVPSICRIRPELPREVDQFMQKAMAKLPADRFSTPHDFINALENLQELMPAIPIDRQDTAERPPIEERGSEAKEAREQQAAIPKQARLLVLSSNQAIPLTGELMVVGRHDPVLGINPEINLADKTVGRRHAYVRLSHGQYTVEDLNALNKTRLNGVVLTPYEERPLKEGDILRFGSVEVRFELR
ncbi:MAG TPA: FHA domain-containing serine/threonine-protein kinase [Ktedonobacteraceae bacterium]|nr:FHA domain-containing serine/threonine-protein kinase [Ktedonobacteraceae bacterium]